MKVEKAIFAAGCFWGVQHQFERIPGVLNTTVGYTGGPEANPAYTQVKAHMTHHVEAIFVDYDADMVSYVDLCKLFFEIHDPSQTDGIGPDLGPQYRTFGMQWLRHWKGQRSPMIVAQFQQTKQMQSKHLSRQSGSKAVRRKP